MIVYCADVGSIPRGRFGWARGDSDAPESGLQGGTDIRKLVQSIADDLDQGRKVTLGFECPLFVPLRDEPKALGCARTGEGRHPWSAGAGAASLTTGLVQVVWVLLRVRETLSTPPEALLDWSAFDAAETGLFLWEAFVVGATKDQGPVEARHRRDAEIAVHAFLAALPDPSDKNAIHHDGPIFSLVGAALLRAGWDGNPSRLSEPCIVIRG